MMKIFFSFFPNFKNHLKVFVDQRGNPHFYISLIGEECKGIVTG